MSTVSTQLPSDNGAVLSDIFRPDTIAENNPKLFTYKQLEWMLKHRMENGLSDSGAVVKVSNKLYIHLPKFLEWFLSRKG